MKKIIRLALLLITPLLLNGCNGNNRPKFVEYGRKVDIATFKDDFASSYNARSFASEETLGSYVFARSINDIATTELRRNNKTVEKTNLKDAERTNDTFDSVKLLLQRKSQASMALERRSSYGKGQYSTNEKREIMYQTTEVQGKKYVVTVDNIRKEYSPYVEVNDEVTSSLVLDTINKNKINGYISRFANQIPLDNEDEEALKEYGFYENNGVYTITYSFEDEVKEFDEGENLLSTTTTKIENIYQINLGDNNLFFKLSETKSEKIVYAKSYENHIIGDESQEDMVSYEDVAFTFKDTKLKEIDLGSYTKVSL